jgi:hypothetical protein
MIRRLPKGTTYEQIGDLGKVPRTWDCDAITGTELLKIHAPVFKSIDDHIAALNRAFRKPVLFIVPAGQAVIGLRERIRLGKAGDPIPGPELWFHEIFRMDGSPYSPAETAFIRAITK